MFSHQFSGFCTLAVEFTFYLCSLLLQLGFHHIRVHAPGATESATVGNTFSCLMCSSQLKEDVKFRVLGGERFITGYKILRENSFVVICCKCVFEADKQLVELIHVQALDVLRAHQQSSLKYQSLTLFLRGGSTSLHFTEFIGLFNSDSTLYLCPLLECS